MRYPARPVPAHRHRGNPASWPRRLAVTAALAIAGAAVLVTGIATPAFAGSLVSPGWAVSQTGPGTLGVNYTYTFTTASTSELDSVTMTVPAGTGGSPAVGTVTPAGLADGGTVSLSGDTLTYSFTPGTVEAGTRVSIEITGLANTTTAGSYTSDITTVDAGSPVDSGTTPAASFSSGLVSSGWAVSRAVPGATGADYTYTFSTTSTSELDSVTMTVPAGTGGSPAVGTVTPAAVAAGGSVSLSGGTLTYSFTPGTVDAGTRVSIEITGLANTTAAGSYTSDITTVDAGSPVDSGTTPAVSFPGGLAATCDNATSPPNCSTSVTATVVGGALGVTAPPSQSWSTTLNGTDQALVDTADASFTVQDVTGSGGGWTVTATATQFTGAGADGNTLPATGTMVYAGSGTDETSGATPGAACAPASACVVPTTTGLTLPAPVTQNGTTLVNLYDAEANTGMGTILIGAVSGGAPAAWWVNVPAGAMADTYSSVITLAISTGPVGT